MSWTVTLRLFYLPIQLGANQPRSSSSSESIFFKTTFSIKYFLRSSYLDKSNYLNYFRQGRIQQRALEAFLIVRILGEAKVMEDLYELSASPLPYREAGNFKRHGRLLVIIQGFYNMKGDASLGNTWKSLQNLKSTEDHISAHPDVRVII